MTAAVVGVAKLAIKIGVGAGVSKVVGDVIKNNVTIDGIEDKILVTVGSHVLGAMIANRAWDYTSTTLDLVQATWQNRKAPKTTTLVVVEDLT